MKEEFLHFIWNTRNFDFIGLTTTTDKSVEILDFGVPNDRGGPDFKNARLKIDGILWAGNVEMHLASSDWDRHGHSGDPNYESVIMHVVLEDDKPVLANGRKIPCLELKGRIHQGVLRNYHRLVSTLSWVPCQNLLAGVPEITKSTWLERMLVERLEVKVSHINELLEETIYDWHAVLCRLIIAGFGFSANGSAFERLSRLVPFNRILQLGDREREIEAMLFGSAGMLNRIFVDAYAVQLQRDFTHLAHKHNLESMNDHAWEWGRVRPANFPTIRIAQLAQILARGNELLSGVSNARRLSDLKQIFKVCASSYWNDHSQFDRPSRNLKKHLGSQSVNSLLLNTVIPFLFCLGKYNSDDSISDRAVNFMAEMTPEHNRITREWSRITMPNQHAGHSQGLIHLKRTYCDLQRCTACAIGHHLMLNKHV